MKILKNIHNLTISKYWTLEHNLEFLACTVNLWSFPFLTQHLFNLSRNLSQDLVWKLSIANHYFQTLAQKFKLIEQIGFDKSYFMDINWYFNVVSFTDATVHVVSFCALPLEVAINQSRWIRLLDRSLGEPEGWSTIDQSRWT